MKRLVTRPSGALAALALLLTLAACGDEEDGSGDGPTTGTEREHAAQPVDPAGAPCSYPPSVGASREVDPPAATAAYSGTVEVTIETNRGDLPATLDATSAPCTVNSFTSLASQGFFDDTPCHRLTTEGIFVLQCGDPDGQGTGGPGYSFADELAGDETYPAGTLAMANSGPDTNGSQFFVVYADTPLPPSYTVFGTVDQTAIDLVAGIAAEGVSGGGADGPPAEAVDITFVEVGDETPPTAPPTTEPAGACSYVPDGTGGQGSSPVEAPPSDPTVKGMVKVSIATTVGPFDLTLDAGAAPCTVGSFVSLVEQGFFDGTPCHRLTTEGILVLQCGDPTGTGTGGPGYSFADELTGNETYRAGTLAMANAGPDTNGSQFFIVYGQTPLPPDYTVFGTASPATVTRVQEVADAGVKGGGPDGPPKTAVELRKATVD